MSINSLIDVKYGGSTHSVDTYALNGWSEATGYTFVDKEMHFNANGKLRCLNLYPNEFAIDNAIVVMNGIHTFSPP